MKLAIMQPYFMPYIGYFQLIKLVDKFIFYDDVTFIKVKGHSGNLYNELVDKMAVEAKEKGEWFNEIH